MARKLRAETMMRQMEDQFMLSRITVLATLAVLALGISGTAQAQPADYRTYFTFSAPVQLPGVTLPAGRYLFRLADGDSGRRVISVLTDDGKKPLAMLMSIPNQLPKAPNDAEIRFMETPASMPPAIKTWWYPGKSIGYEFIYPRKQALQIAQASKESVLTTKADVSGDELKTADLSRVDGSGVPADVKAEENPAPAPASGRAQQGQVAAAGGSSSIGSAAQGTRADESARSSARTRLPQTASSMPTALLFGALAMCAGLGLSLWPRPRI
jgi:hypothetical protein